jgi:hypothetical protein
VPAGQQHRTASLADASLQASSSADISRSAPFLLGRKDPETICGTIWILFGMADPDVKPLI